MTMLNAGKDVDLGATGIWSMELRSIDPSAARDVAAELHSQGWGAMWLVGSGGPGIWADAENLLSAGSDSAVALGVMSIWGPDARMAADEHARLVGSYGPRLMTGLGVSNAQSAAANGRAFSTPIAEMSSYLDDLDSSSTPIPVSQRMLGALGPRMVDLAGRRTAGIHPFLVTPESNVANRERLSPRSVIAPHQAVVIESDPVKARETARNGVGMFIGFPSYQASLRRLGFGDDDLIPGGSDRLIDSVVAWGTLDDIAQRVRDHHDAGADHVALHVLTGDRRVPMDEWRRLAPLLAGA